MSSEALAKGDASPTISQADFWAISGIMLDEVKKYVMRSPFKPFVINTNDGLSRPVPSLGHILIGQYIAVLDSEGLIEIISPRHISSVALQAEHYQP